MISLVPVCKSDDDGCTKVELRRTSRTYLQTNKADASSDKLPYTLIQVRSVQSTGDNYYRLVADIVSELAWITTACRPPLRDDVVSFIRADIEWLPNIDNMGVSREIFCISCQDDTSAQVPRENDSTCWHQLFAGFTVAVGFPVPPRPDKMCGLELPLSVMVSFAQVEYPIPYKDGYVLKGWEYALFPIRTYPGLNLPKTPSALQWHLFKTKKHRLYMMEVETVAGYLQPITAAGPSENFSAGIKQIQRHFLGLYESSEVHIGTNASLSDTIQPIQTGRHLCEERPRLSIEWNRSVSGTVGIPILSVVTIGASTGFRVRTKNEQRHKFVQERILSQMLDDVGRDSVILYDLAANIAWMLPKVSVVMYLVQCRVKERHPNTEISYPKFDEVIRNDWNINEFLEQILPSGLNLRETFLQFTKILDAMKDYELLKPERNLKLIDPFKKKKYLPGIDFAKLVHMPQYYSIIKHEINSQQSGNWLEMLLDNWDDSTVNEPFRVTTLFCNNIPLTSQPLIPTTNETCNAWFPPPAYRDYMVTTIHCLKRVAEMHGTDPVRLSQNYYWECGVHFPHAPCGRQGCNRLQKIAKGRGQRSEVLTHLINSASPSASIVFGESLLVRGERTRCTPIPTGLATNLNTRPTNATSNEEPLTAQLATIHVNGTVIEMSS